MILSPEGILPWRMNLASVSLAVWAYRVGGWFRWGLELRAWFGGSDLGEGTPTERLNEPLYNPIKTLCKHLTWPLRPFNTYKPHKTL